MTDYKKSYFKQQAQIETINGYNDDINDLQLAKLREVFPEVFSEGKVDWSKLKATLGEAVDETERYGLGWKGKSSVFARIQEKSVDTLRPDRDNSLDWDDTKNMFIEGDNLNTLKVLHKSYYGKVKMIYIDPPYNTGNDFVYNDDFKQTRRSYAEQAGLADDDGFITRDDGLRPNTGGHKHSNWLSMMYPRLFLARNLLRQDGVIFVSIDDNEVHNLRLMMNEIFGEENFVAQIVRNTNSSKNQSLFVSVSHEYCLVYARNISTLTEKHADNKWAVEKNNVKEYKKRVEKLKSEGLSHGQITEELKNLTNYPRFIDFTNYWYFDERGLYRKDNLGGVKNGSTEPLHNPLTNSLDAVPPGGFRYSPEKLQALVAENRIHFHTDGSLPTIKRYLDENSTQRPKSIMSDDQRPDYSLLQAMGLEFDNPKQMAFMQRILSISDKDAIVLDFFAGSGTTAHAVMQQNLDDGGNRQWICVQLPELTDETSEAHKAGYKTIADIARERIRRAGAKIRQDYADKLAGRKTPLDLGFRAYTVAASNFKPWNEQLATPDDIRQATLDHIDPLEPGATDENILTELLLKRGISPLVAIEPRSNFTLIPSENLAICLAADLAQTDFDRLLASGASHILLLDRAFAANTPRKTNFLLQARQHDVTVEVV